MCAILNCRSFRGSTTLNGGDVFLAKNSRFFDLHFEFSPLPDTSVQETTLFKSTVTSSLACLPLSACGEGLGGEVLAQTPKLSSYEDTSGRGWGWGAYGKTHTPPLNAVLPYDDGVGVASAIPIIIPS
jgi:hypothetical protein